MLVLQGADAVPGSGAAGGGLSFSGSGGSWRRLYAGQHGGVLLAV